MGVEPVIMSAGELESEKAGQRHLNLCLLFTCFMYSAIFCKVAINVVLRRSSKGLTFISFSCVFLLLLQENLGGLYVTDTGRLLK